MPKQKNVTVEEIHQILNELEEASGKLRYAEQRISNGYCDPIPDPMKLISTLSVIQRDCLEMTSRLIVRAEMDKMKSRIANQ